VRNYWRGFYAAVIGAFVFRLLAMKVENQRTFTELFSTNIDTPIPYHYSECPHVANPFLLLIVILQTQIMLTIQLS
jgi:hypothetical protein